VTGPSGGDKAAAEQALLDRALTEHAWVFTKSRLFVLDGNFPGVARLRRLITVTHVLVRLKSDITVTKTGDFLPDGSYMADIGRKDGKVRMRVIEYYVHVDGQHVPEMFCLVTDLDDWERHPAVVLAAAYKWRWDGSATALREAKSAIRGAGPSTGLIFRSHCPDMMRQEHAAWITSAELVRATARAAARSAAPARKGRRAGGPDRVRDQRLPGPLLRLRPVRAAVDPALPRRVLVAADEDTVRDVIHTFNAKGLAALDPRWAGGRPRLIK
jgi:Winged helix-turn helix